MLTAVLRKSFVLALVLSMCGAAMPAAAGNQCRRECLKGLMDDYLGALVARDPRKMKTTPGVRFTENTNRMTLGDGLWQTIDQLGTFKFYIEDPTTSQAVFYGTVKENGLTALLGVRIKAQQDRISEIETMVVRQATGIHGTFDALTQLDKQWESGVPEGSRATRKELMHAADQYFNGIVQGNGDIVPFADDCVRIENGAQTSPTPASASHPLITTRESFNTKRFNYIHEITNRRFLVVDPEHGLVVAFAMFQHPGNIKTPAPPDTGPRPRAFPLSSYPNTTQIMETFQIRHGKLQNIFAYIALAPYRQTPGW